MHMMYLNPLLINSVCLHYSFETSNYVQDSIFMVVMEGHPEFSKTIVLDNYFLVMTDKLYPVIFYLKDLIVL